MPPLNYTTKIEPSKTLGEIQALLAKYGARSISIDYDAGDIEAVAFVALVNNQSVSFRLPSNWRGLHRLLDRDPKVPASLATEVQARRVAWRIIKDRIAAQFALVEAGQATLQQVMLPYAVTSDGRTLYEHFEQRTDRLLGSGDTL